MRISTNDSLIKANIDRQSYSNEKQAEEIELSSLFVKVGPWITSFPRQQSKSKEMSSDMFYQVDLARLIFCLVTKRTFGDHIIPGQRLVACGD
jgi:hypothetical protein